MSNRLEPHTDLNFINATYVFDDQEKAATFDYEKCTNNIYSSFFKHMIEYVALNVADASNINDKIMGDERKLSIFNFYSNTAKSNILFQNNNTKKTWKNIKVGSIYLIEDNDNKDVIIYPKFDLNSFHGYNYQLRPWWKYIQENPYDFGITATYKDNEGGNNFVQVRTIWYEFEYDEKNYFLLIDLFVDSSDILSLQEKLIFNKYYIFLIILFSLILFIFLAQMNFEQMNINWRGLHQAVRSSTERIINRAIAIMNRNIDGN